MRIFLCSIILCWNLTETTETKVNILYNTMRSTKLNSGIKPISLKPLYYRVSTYLVSRNKYFPIKYKEVYEHITGMEIILRVTKTIFFFLQEWVWFLRRSHQWIRSHCPLATLRDMGLRHSWVQRNSPQLLVP